MDLEILKDTYPDAVKNTISGLNKYYLKDVASVESYKLTRSGTIMIVDGEAQVIIQSYPPVEAPEIVDDIPQLDEDYIAEYKVDGYNVRLVYLESIDNFLGIQRGGFICSQTTGILREAFSKELMGFFKKYPDIVLCMEVVGRKSVNAINYEFNEQNWGFGDVGYFVFDAFDKGAKGKWYDADFIEGLRSLGLSVIPRIGEVDDGNILVDKMEKLDQHFDGVVLKSAANRDRNHIYKLRWEYFIKKFQDKIRVKDKGGTRKERAENIILDHFFQGYPEKELGLKEGMSPAELEEYENKIKVLDDVVRSERSNIGKTTGEISRWLMQILNTKGDFDDKMQDNLHRGIRNRLGGFVGRSMSREDRKARVKDKG